MSGLCVGDEVTIFCPICGVGIDPWKKTCGRECSKELGWREALSALGQTYTINPDSRLGHIANREGED